MGDTPRLRMFAGPNGSGKSTIKSLLRPELLGYYVNPDEIQVQLQSPSGIDLRQFGLAPTLEDLRSFFAGSSLIKTAELEHIAAQISLTGSHLIFPVQEKAAYLASVTADFVRQSLIEAGVSFTFETVMSSPDKIELLRSARLRGFRTYLYYIATEDVAINISRVRTRVAFGGHDVPTKKIISRYARSLDLLLDPLVCLLQESFSTQQIAIAKVWSCMELVIFPFIAAFDANGIVFISLFRLPHLSIVQQFEVTEVDTIGGFLARSHFRHSCISVGWHWPSQ